MTKKRKKKKSKQLDPQKILENKTSVTALELIRLIHKVNPSKAGYQPGKQQKQYQLKAGLQSLLINRFHDSLKVSLENPDNPQLISLEMKHFDEDACHALLAELDDNARSWAREQIDLQSLSDKTDQHSSKKKKSASANEPQPLNEITGKYSGTELLEMGRRALEEYDYEQCELFFRNAFEKTGEDPETAAALLEFYVDHLAAYDKAIALTNKLTTKIIKDEKIKGLAALSLVQSGQVEDALACLGKTRCNRDQEVYLLAGIHFAGNKDIKQAMACHAELDPDEAPELRAEIIQLANEIEELRAGLLKPIIEEMSQAWEKGEQEKAIQLADEILAQDSSNRDAKRIRKLFSHQLQQEKIRQLLTRTDNAHDQNEYSREAKLLQQIIDLQGEDKALTTRLQQALRKSNRQQQEEEIATVIQQLSQGNTRDGLLQFTELSRQQQQQVRDRHPHNCIPPLLRIINSKTVIKQGTMVAAVMALNEANQLLTQDNKPKDTLSLLQAHMKTLTAVPEATEIYQKAKTQLRDFARAQLADLLKKAQHALKHEQLDNIRQLLDNIDTSLLAVDKQTQLTTLQAKLHLLEQQQELKTRYTNPCDNEDHLAARIIAREISSIDKSNEWQDKVQYHGTAIQKQFALTRIKVKELPPCYDLGLGAINLESANSALLDDGRRVVYASTCGKYLIVYIMDMKQQDRKEVVLLQAPRPMKYVDVEVSADTIWVISSLGSAIQISLTPLDVLAYHDYTSFLRDDEIVERVDLFPDTHYAWLTARMKEENEITRVINTEKMIIERRLNLAGWPVKLCNRTEKIIADNQFLSNRVKIYSDRGKSIQEVFLPEVSIIDGAVLDPDTGEYFFLKRPDIDLDDLALGHDLSEEDIVSLSRISKDGQMTESVDIEDAEPEGAKYFGRADSTGLLYVCFINSKADLILQAWDPANQNLKKLYEIPVSRRVQFATDEFSRNVVIINSQPDGYHLVPLDSKPPQCVADDLDYRLPDDLPGTTCFDCRTFSPAVNAMKQAFLATTQNATDREYNYHIDQLKSSGQPDDILAVIYALQERPTRTGMSLNLRSWFAEKYPDHPFARTELAEKALRKQNWQQCVNLLEDLSRTELDDEPACHICHLLGLAYLGQGKPDQAIAIWEEGIALEWGTCKLTGLINHAADIINFMKNKGTPGDVHLPVLLHIFIRIDQALADQNWVFVIETLEQFSLDSISIREIQLLARFSEAFLHMNTQPDTPRHLGKIMVFAVFSAQQAEKNEYGPGSFLAPVVSSYPESRLQELADQAEEWLSDWSSKEP